ncbi:alpha/beta-hydrolase [Neolentinus lepideus HHB14362 ss-1]|uniref:Alpha/beta-hydrolase n=1 Tax=Neolentinus lepideus HHB14362 ss-1 TaxID=1314782 RepID=A0A165V7Y6_9AGAM|nr:alpha/beta-hydrolase [Neolentinus lepideus HHB14362 ss-1]
MAPRIISKVLQSTDGTIIYAEAVGNVDGPSIVFVHGFLTCTIVFNDMFADERLLREFYLVLLHNVRKVRYDLRGHGRSGMPEDVEGHSSSAYADDFMAVVNATVAADYCQNVDPIPVSGIVYLSALPYVGQIMPKIRGPVLAAMRPKFTTNDPAVYRELILSFTNSLFADPDRVPFETRCAMYGSSLLQTQKAMQCAVMRPQDPTKLLEAGSKGIPLLVVYGTNDKNIIGENVVKELKPHFSNMEVVPVEGAHHAVFLDNPEEVISALVSFAHRVSMGRELLYLVSFVVIIGFPPIVDRQLLPCCSSAEKGQQACDGADYYYPNGDC